MNQQRAITNYKAAAAAALREALRMGRYDKNAPAARAEVEAARVLRRLSR
jgi:hypothetical protein